MRARGGQLILRIEDLDGPRINKGAAEAAIVDLNWLGLDWDDGPFYQQSRLPEYQSALVELALAGLAYPCVCSRKDVELAASAPHTAEEGPIYPGTCRAKWRDSLLAFQTHQIQQVNQSIEIETGRKPCWRFDISAAIQRFAGLNAQTLTVRDRFLGERTWQVQKELGDFVIWKKDDEPAYQLAVVVDDADQGVTDVLRAEDLFSSAARQELIYMALGKTPPRWAHLPLVVGADGRRLAKRHGDTTIRAFREAGHTADEILGLLAFWSGLQETPLECDLASLLAVWQLDSVPKSQPIWSGDWPTV